MDVEFLPARAAGVVSAPPSKSMAHRYLILAGCTPGKTVLRGIAESDDLCATMDCLRALGATVTRAGDTVTVEGTDMTTRRGGVVLPCRASGTTMRFLLPIALLSGSPARLVGMPELLHRPIDLYTTIYKNSNISLKIDEGGVDIVGKLRAGNYEIAGDVSSQFVSGTLLALALLPEESRVCVLPPVESRPYIQMTAQALAAFGYSVRESTENVYLVGGNHAGVWGGAENAARSLTVEGDFTQAAALAAFGEPEETVSVTGLSRDSAQGDSAYPAYFAALRAGNPTISLADTPDLAPTLFTLAAMQHGATFTDTRRLALKECDRAAAMAEELEKCGVTVRISGNSVAICPCQLTPPRAALDAHDDHRVAMALSLWLSRTGGVLHGAEAVGKSFPDFFDRLRALGVSCRIVGDGEKEKNEKTF